MITKKELIANPSKVRPHVVILGAGASKQAFFDGDANGNKLPLMSDLIKIVGLEEALSEFGISSRTNNFEELYSRLYEENQKSDLIQKIEKKTYSYFDNLKLPDFPTLYDHLLLSLRSKDAIATFNWDPFLMDAWERNIDFPSLPEIIHLHGNVRLGYCFEHGVLGSKRIYCPECDRPLTPTKLLYPTSKKNYSADPSIKSEWERLRKLLSSAFTLTIFGYSKPSTDMEAVQLLKSGWRKRGERELETIEIIDIADQQTVVNNWKEFYNRQHYIYHKDFYNSWIPNHARRTVESLMVPTVHGDFVDNYSLPKDYNFEHLHSWFRNLIKPEGY